MTKPNRGYIIDIEKATEENTDYRRVLWTSTRGGLYGGQLFLGDFKAPE